MFHPAALSTVLVHLTPQGCDLGALSCACRALRGALSDNDIWRAVIGREFPRAASSIPDNAKEAYVRLLRHRRQEEEDIREALRWPGKNGMRLLRMRPISLPA